MPTTVVADPTGAAAWGVATINTNTAGVVTNVDYFFRAGGAEQVDYTGPNNTLNDTVFYNTNGGTVASYYGVGSNPALPLYSYSQYTYGVGGSIDSIIGIFAGKLYVNSTP